MPWLVGSCRFTCDVFLIACCRVNSCVVPCWSIRRIGSRRHHAATRRPPASQAPGRAPFLPSPVPSHWQRVARIYACATHVDCNCMHVQRPSCPVDTRLVFAVSEIAPGVVVIAPRFVVFEAPRTFPWYGDPRVFRGYDDPRAVRGYDARPRYEAPRDRPAFIFACVSQRMKAIHDSQAAELGRSGVALPLPLHVFWGLHVWSPLLCRQSSRGALWCCFEGSDGAPLCSFQIA